MPISWLFTRSFQIIEKCNLA